MIREHGKLFTSHWSLVIAHCSLLALALVLLWPVVRHPDWWLWKPESPHSDLAVTHWPNAHFTRRVLWEEGRFPLWRSTIMSGAPFAANPLAGLYYPPNWFFLFLPWLPLEMGFNLSAVVHLWLAGATMYALMRRGFDVGAWGALAAAVAYEATPKLLAHLSAGHVGWTQAWGWLPVVILCVVQAGKSASGQVCKWGVGAGAALAIQFLADVRMAAYTLAAAVTLALFFAIRKSPFVHSYIRTFVHSLIRTFAISLGLTACQWLPLLALLPEMTRASMTLHDAAAWSLPWRYLLGLLVADRGGFHEWMTYVGLSTLALAALGVWQARRVRERRWLTGWLLGLVVFAAWFSLGENGGLFTLLYRLIPGMGLLRVPPRIWVLVTFAAAALAGLGVDETIRRGSSRRRTGPLVFGLIAVGLVAADLLSVDATLVGALPPRGVFAPVQDVAVYLARARENEDFRVYSPSFSLPQHTAELYGLDLAGGVDPLQLRVYADYVNRAAGVEVGGYGVTLPTLPPGCEVETALAGVVPDARMMAQLSVRYAVSAFPFEQDQNWLLLTVKDGVYLYENLVGAALPPGSLASGDPIITLRDGTVLFEYQPRPVYWGWAISGVTLLGLVGWWVLGRRHP
ncbi:MAG TPA: hypothetical protein G4N99_13870 [Thermoflexia bacterium]|nr:hypothetical protein [Thermoflexia bacterium]